jgi:hypothetical protein
MDAWGKGRRAAELFSYFVLLSRAEAGAKPAPNAQLGIMREFSSPCPKPFRSIASPHESVF